MHVKMEFDFSMVMQIIELQVIILMAKFFLNKYFFFLQW